MAELGRTVSKPVDQLKGALIQVMSRDLCKLAKGALAPFQVKPVKDGENNPLDTLHIHKAHHRAGPAADFDEAPLNHVRRPELPPEVTWTLEEREQLGQIPEELRHQRRVGVLPPAGEGLGVRHGLRPTRGRFKRLRSLCTQHR